MPNRKEHNHRIDPVTFRSQLLAWYQTAGRDLPWRRTRDPYHIWLSEVMAQQTRIQTVIPYFERFINRFPTVKTLADADQQSVLKMWEGLGYYSRARNLRKAAQMVQAEFKGKIPLSYEQLLSLPGVGDYMASAISSIAGGEVQAAVDGNVKRVLARLYCDSEPVNTSRSHRHFRLLAQALVSPEHPGDFNQAMMELGARICKPRNPDCEACPVMPFCLANDSGQTDGFPVREKRKPIPEYEIAVGVVYREDQVLITKRKESGLLGGLWEFPGGKIQPGETASEACIREIQEETGVHVIIREFLSVVPHAYTHFKVKLHVFTCDYESGEVMLNGPVEYCWIPIHELENYPFPGANRKFIPLLY